MTAPARPDYRLLTAAVAVVVFGVGAVVAFAMASRDAHHAAAPRSVSCGAPALSGPVVDATLVDMAMMRGSGRAQNQWRHWHAGMMRVLATPSTVAAGQVSLRVTNAGLIKHELVVLPLAAGQSVGARRVGGDGRVDEASSLGEASASCAGGAGEGIQPGATGWTTLNLPRGRYELLCNLPGHYTAGMYAELDVS